VTPHTHQLNGRTKWLDRKVERGKEKGESEGTSNALPFSTFFPLPTLFLVPIRFRLFRTRCQNGNNFAGFLIQRCQPGRLHLFWVHDHFIGRLGFSGNSSAVSMREIKCAPLGAACASAEPPSNGRPRTGNWIGQGSSFRNFSQFRSEPQDPFGKLS